MSKLMPVTSSAGDYFGCTESRSPNRKGRPNYVPKYRRRVAIAACEPGFSVAELAQAHGLNFNRVFEWHRQLRAWLLDAVEHGTAVLPRVTLSDISSGEKAEPALQAVESPRKSAPAVSGIGIEWNGAGVRVTGMVDPVQLRLMPA